MPRTNPPRLLLLAALLPALFTLPTHAVDFDRHIRPILSENCFACHGPDDKARKAKLRLDTQAGAAANPNTLSPGHSSKSDLIHRITTPDPDDHMPPPDSGKKLTPDQVATLKKWIDAGAPWQSHWAFVPPAPPARPAKLSNPAWPANPIDHYILEKLDKAGLKPSPEADRPTLIRRLSLDLRGLPPTIEEVDAFLADTSPDAYEKLVDRMLASPHYGEKMAQLWLDLARFADTSGYHFDSTRQMWLWRDYVINAFNHNKPFNQFTIEQLAGDLIASPTTESQIASGFNRNTRFNEEGGADPKEFSIRYAVDRTNTLGMVWLGVTLKCAECHTHKYDPISHTEYYQLYAFFNNIEEPMTSGNHGAALPPLMKVSTPEKDAALQSAKDTLAAIEKEAAALLAAVQYTDPGPGQPTNSTPKPPQDIAWIDDETPAGAKLAGDGAKPWQWVTASPHPVLSGHRSLTRTGPGTTQDYFIEAPKPLTLSSGDKLFAHVYLDPKNPPKTVMLQFNVAGNWEHRAYWGDDKIPFGTGDAPGHRHLGPLPAPGTWARLEVDSARVGLKPGDKISGWAFSQHDGTTHWDKAGVHTAHPPDDRHLKSLAAWEKLVTATNPAEVPKEIKAAIKIEPAKRKDDQKKQILDYYLRNIFEGTKSTLGPLEARRKAAEDQARKVEESIPTVMVSRELPEKDRRKAHILLRGNFETPGEEVQRNVPAVFPPLPANALADRLALANWLVDGRHPLTARVAVNRFWKQLLGTGLVKTMGDFGSQGEPPTHPELLDFLAVEFQQDWNVKRILKLIATSRTYRQAARVDPEAARIDPHNRLLSRSSRFRLTAEEVRDNALAIAGHLSPNVGGPSVNPYQPANYYSGKYGWKWDTSKGDALYRRGLYTFWRRTSLYPTFAMFDAPSREISTCDRARTNTPLQALATMNDPTFVEASRVLAERAMRHAPKDLEAQLTYAFRRAVARPPTPAELTILKQTHAHQLQTFNKDPTKIEGLLTTGDHPRPKDLPQPELAALTAVANVILNLDETIVRE